MTTQWYLYKNGKQIGPLSWKKLVEQKRTGIIGPSDMVWTEGMENWARADQVKGLVSAPSPSPPGPRSTPQAGAPPSYQQRGSGSHRTAPAPGRGKGVLIALIVVLVVVLLGGGYFVASDLLFDSGNGVIADSGDETVTPENGPDSGGVSQTAVDSAGLWAPPLEYNQAVVDLMLEGGDTMADIQSQYNEFVSGMPKKGDVPCPSYPGAYICNYVTGKGTLNDREISTASVVLLSADPVDSVLAFYKDQLPGYSHKETPMVEDHHFLWEGGADDYQDAMSGFIPSIVIESPLGFEFYMMLMPEARAQITISYPPSN